MTSAPVVSLRQVVVDYNGLRALEAFDLEVGQGERVALVGPSGAGKTTVLSLCVGAEAPTAGSVTILGRDLASSSAPELRAVRRQVGTVSQHLDLVGPLRVIHNVNGGHLGSWSCWQALRSLVRPRDVETARRALAQLGIADKLFDRTNRLSGGERQRVALARVLVQEPALILADEPVSSLDPACAAEVMALLCDLAAAGAHRTLIVSLHDLALARSWCDRVVGIRKGRVAFDLPAAEVTDDVATALYGVGVEGECA